MDNVTPLSHKIKRKNNICRNVDGPRLYHTKWSKSERERQIYITYIQPEAPWAPMVLCYKLIKVCILCTRHCYFHRICLEIFHILRFPKKLKIFSVYIKQWNQQNLGVFCFALFFNLSIIDASDLVFLLNSNVDNSMLPT